MNRRHEINKWYRVILGRLADPSGLSHYATSKLSINDVKDILLLSDEYRERNVPFSGAVINKEWALANLMEIQNIFKKYNVNFWLDSGTLLGYYRNQNFISHDHDIDIGVNFLEFDSNILTDIFDAGWTVMVHGYPKNSLFIRITKRSTVVDIFFYYPDNGKVRYSVFYPDSSHNLQLKQMNYVFNQFNLKEIEFLGHTFLVPENELEWITTHYGPNWHIENKDWNWRTSPFNIELTEYSFERELQLQQLSEWAPQLPVTKWGV